MSWNFKSSADDAKPGMPKFTTCAASPRSCRATASWLAMVRASAVSMSARVEPPNIQIRQAAVSGGALSGASRAEKKSVMLMVAEA